MSVEALSRAAQQPDSVPIAESAGWSAPGVQVLVTGVVLVLAAIVLLVLGISMGANSAGPIALICVAVLLAILGHLALRGLTPVVAGEARVIQLFGRYRGTVRAPGLHWVNPFARRRKVSVRIRNHETAQAKVNDADGNPIEIAAVVGERTRIVEGAVGMVQLALRRLQEEDVVELDEERKAAMVSNLLVVLCSEQATQQVVNTGSLYQ